MKHLKKFSTTAAYKQYYNNIDNYVSPNLCLCTNTYKLHMNPLENRIIVRFATYKDDLEVNIYGVNANIENYVSRIKIDEDDIYTDKNGNKHEDLYNGNFSYLNNTYTYIFKNKGLHIVRYTLKNPEIICDRMFEHCTLMEAIKIPNGITSIGNYAFCECFSEYVHFPAILEIPDSVTNIGECALSDLLLLLHLILGKGINVYSEIHNSFTNMRYQTSYDITCKAMQAPYYAGWGVFSLGEGRWDKTLYIPKGAAGYEDWPSALHCYGDGWTVVEI